jgi:hypothetical protein
LFNSFFVLLHVAAALSYGKMKPNGKKEKAEEVHRRGSGKNHGPGADRNSASISGGSQPEAKEG